MSLYGSLRTAVSGMNAQANRLGTVADNIANANVTGYKKASVEFSSLLAPNNGGTYASGSVKTSISYAIAQQGGLRYSSSVTDLAIQGSGFFVVSDGAGATNLTRVGSFVPDGNGFLVNAAGHKLMGYDLSNGEPTVVANGLARLVPVRLATGGLQASASSQGEIRANLPALADPVSPAIANVLPSENSPYSNYSERLSFGHSGLSSDVVGDIYFTKVSDNTWEVTAFAREASIPAGFPYDTPMPGMTATTTLTFDPATGAIVDGNPILVLDPGFDPLQIDLSSLSQSIGPAGTPGLRPTMNLPSNYPVIDVGGGDILPSQNDPASVRQIKQTLTGYTGLGNPIAVDSYYVKVGPDTWEATFFRSADATAGTFPYGIAGSAPLASTTLTFDPATGELVSGSPLTIDLGGGDEFEIDYSQMVSRDDTDAVWANSLGTVEVNLNLSPLAASVEPFMLGSTPADNQTNSVFTSKTSFAAFDYLGQTALLDVYFTRGPDDTWEVAIFDQADASTNGFPYGLPGSAPLATTLLEFDPQTGRLTSEAELSITIPGGADLRLDLSSLTQLASDFSAKVDVDGSAASSASGYSISPDGVVYTIFQNGNTIASYKLALANVESPDNLDVLAGNIYALTQNSGDLFLGFPNSGSMGSVVSGALENSNVDIAEELTGMIDAQRNYTANSKVFQTGSELLDVLVNLRR